MPNSFSDLAVEASIEVTPAAEAADQADKAAEEESTA